MGEHMNGLERLGGHVSGSLEHARAEADAASRVRARLARGEAPTPAAPLRLRRGVVPGALALVAAVLLLVVAPWRPNGARSNGTTRALTFVVGGDAAAGPGSGAANGTVGAFLAAPQAMDLPLSFSDGTNVTIAAGSRARVAELSHRGARVLVESGVVHADVVHREDTKWLVDAGPFEVKVTGTRFDVAWDPADQAIVVTLREGSVVVTGCGLPAGHQVAAGQQLRASCKTGVSSLAAIAAPIATATPTVEPTPTAVSSLPDAPAVPSQRPTGTAPALALASPSFSSSSSSASPSTASDLLARANADRYAGRFEAATDSLQTVRRRFRNTDAAATAAFELGRIAFDAQRDFTAAGDWFDTYLRERPTGALAREALGRALESRHRAGDSTHSAQLASRYVTAYPDGPHAALARRLVERGSKP